MQGDQEPRIVRSRGSRRATRPGAAGTDPAPQLPKAPVKAAEDTDEAWEGTAKRVASGGPNDAELQRNVPPHW
ncbi:MAG TPA: hypothetical protein VNJ54_15805 [Plantibacter sp.]|uniref:hypothetical protein n=1 Tax=unclassified Plantibacter TaxID=2624265 RepID=UPI002CE1E097|nr:hypothetical protein [Plantibacter sp.]